MALTTGTNNYSPARYQVSQVSGYGNYTTIQSAIDAATAAGVPADILIMPGTYTEDINMSASVNINGWGADGTNISSLPLLNNVVINGVIYALYDGSAVLSGITCTSNGDGCLNLDSSGLTKLTVKNCQFYLTDNQCVFMENTSALLEMYYCNVYLTDALVGFNIVGGTVNNYFCNFVSDHAGMSTNSFDACVSGSLNFHYCKSSVTVTTLGGNSIITGIYSEWNIPGTSGASIRMIGSGTKMFEYCKFNSGANTAVTISSTATVGMYGCEITSSATAAISGAGTLNYGWMIFTNSKVITVTTQNPTAMTTFQGGTNLTSYTTGDTLYASAANILSKLSIGTTGQVLTVAAGIPAWANSATVSMPYTDQASNTTAAVNTGYFITAACTITLPATPAQGSVVAFEVTKAATLPLIITAPAGASIQLGNTSSSTSRSATNSANGDSIYLVYRSADTTWYATQSSGSWSLT